MNLIQHFVNGKTTPGKSERSGKVFNPATGEQESQVKLGSKSDLDNAVQIAKKAFNVPIQMRFGSQTIESWMVYNKKIFYFLYLNIFSTTKIVFENQLKPLDIFLFFLECFIKKK